MSSQLGAEVADLIRQDGANRNCQRGLKPLRNCGLPVRGMLESVEQANISERESDEQLALAGGRTDYTDEFSQIPEEETHRKAQQAARKALKQRFRNGRLPKLQKYSAQNSLS
jgi:hypothetical protein